MPSAASAGADHHAGGNSATVPGYASHAGDRPRRPVPVGPSKGASRKVTPNSGTAEYSACTPRLDNSGDQPRPPLSGTSSSTVLFAGTLASSVCAAARTMARGDATARARYVVGCAVVMAAARGAMMRTANIVQRV
eukprot:7383609-Prymnesium_polylepis.3